MKLLKAFWDKLGEEKFTSYLMAIGCTLLTIYNVFFTSNIPEFNALMVFLNGAMIFALIMNDKE